MIIPPCSRASGLARTFAAAVSGRLGLTLSRLLLTLLCLQLRHIGRSEVDWVEQKRRKAGVRDGFGNDLAREREEQARRFDEEDRLKRLIGEIA